MFGALQLYVCVYTLSIFCIPLYMFGALELSLDHSYIHTYMHTYFQTCIHTYIQHKYTHTHHTHTHKHTHTHTHTHRHTHTDRHTHTHTPSSRALSLYGALQLYTNACINALYVCDGRAVVVGSGALIPDEKSALYMHQTAVISAKSISPERARAHACVRVGMRMCVCVGVCLSERASVCVCVSSCKCALACVRAYPD